jgi:hypothetical protein
MSMERQVRRAQGLAHVTASHPPAQLKHQNRYQEQRTSCIYFAIPSSGKKIESHPILLGHHLYDVLSTYLMIS